MKKILVILCVILTILGCKADKKFYQLDTVESIHINLPEADWLELKRKARDKKYIPAQMTYRGKTLDSIGIKFRGVWTLTMSVNEQGEWMQPKVPMKLKLNKYKKQKLLGIKKVNLNSLFFDPSLMRDKLSNWTFNEMGVKCPKATHAKLYVNGKYQGVYGMVEAVDKTFGKQHFGAIHSLYKEVWPNSDDPNYYKQGRKYPKKGSIDDLLDLYRNFSKLKESEEKAFIQKHFDVEYLMNYLAVDVAINNYDGVRSRYTYAPASHNFYWAHKKEDDKFYLIPWDHDGTFMSETIYEEMPFWGEQRKVYCDSSYWSFWGPEAIYHAECDPLLGALAKHFMPEYKAACKKLLNGPFKDGVYETKIKKWEGQLKKAVEEDPFIDTLVWKQHLVNLKKDVVVLRNRLRQRVEKTKSKEFGLDVKSVEGFESTSDVMLNAGVAFFANSASYIQTIINSENPIAGEKDMRINFRFRNQVENPKTGAYGQWGMFRIPFNGYKEVDLSDVKAIRFKVKSDQQRKLRISVNSRVYKCWNIGVQNGWIIKVSDSITQVELRVSEIKTERFEECKTTPALALKNCSGLSFSAYQLGRDEKGMYPKGKFDDGYYQIDDIEFVFNKE